MWFRIDDTFAFHPKALAAGNEACGLWVRAGAWSCQTLTDGFIPDSMVTVLGGRKAVADRLVEVGLWMPVDGGYLFHEWAERQPSRSVVEERRKASRARQQRWRDQHRGDDGQFESGDPDA